MKKTTLFLLLFTVITSQLKAQGIFNSSIHTAVNYGSVNSPTTERVQNVIDQNPATKFLDFAGADGIGFEVDLLGVPAMAISMEIVTANDSPERDPKNYEIFGSNDGTNYTSIATGVIPCVSTRLLSRTFTFTNTNAYTIYRVNFTVACGTTTTHQIADVQLYSAIGNIPVINCPGDTFVTNTPGSCDAVVTYAAVTATDIEDGSLTPTLETGLPSGSTFPLGETLVTYSVTDMDGNLQTCSFIVTVNDAEAPTVTCPAAITTNVDNLGDTSVEVTYAAPVVADNCGLANPKSGFTPLTNINNKVYYLSDGMFSPSDAFIDAESQGGFVGTIRNGGDLATISTVLQAVGFTDSILIGYSDVAVEGSFEWHSGDTSVFTNWNMNEPNNSGNEDYVVMQYSMFWNDVNNSGSFRYLLEVDYTPNQIAGLASGSLFPVGTTTNTFEITDISGNSTLCSFDVTVSSTLGVKEVVLQNSLILSPNPASHVLTLTNNSQMELTTITIFDMNGRVIETMNHVSGNRTINVEGFATGLYLIKMTSTTGETIIKRFIKQ